MASRSPSNASAETAGSAAAISVRVACTLWSSVAPQNACHQPPPWSRSGWTRPSATERCASSTSAKIARALPPAAGSAGGASARRISCWTSSRLRRKAVAGQRELRDRRLPEREIARRQRAVGVANEEDRRRILLPDELQRRVHGCAVLGHQPFKVTVKADLGVPRTVSACRSALWLTPPDSVSDLLRKKEIEMARARRQPKRILNCIPSRERDEDWRIDTAADAGVVAAAPRIPPKKDLRQTWWRINDQGTTGSCVGWGSRRRRAALALRQGEQDRHERAALAALPVDGRQGDRRSSTPARRRSSRRRARA